MGLPPVLGVQPSIAGEELRLPEREDAPGACGVLPGVDGVDGVRWMSSAWPKEPACGTEAMPLINARWVLSMYSSRMSLPRVLMDAIFLEIFKPFSFRLRSRSARRCGRAGGRSVGGDAYLDL